MFGNEQVCATRGLASPVCAKVPHLSDLYINQAPTSTNFQRSYGKIYSRRSGHVQQLDSRRI